MAARALKMTRDASDFVKGLDPKQYKQVVQRVLALPENPTPPDSAKLVGSEDLYRVDQGEFRIVYKFDDALVSIIVIQRRNDDQVYKDVAKLKRGQKQPPKSNRPHE